MDLTINPFETDELVEQYMEFHYEKKYYDVAKCARICRQFMTNSTPNNSTNSNKKVT